MSINKTLESLRVSYRKASLDIPDCHQNPELQFNEWFSNALESQCEEANAFTLSTVSEGRPHARVVLLKGIHQHQFIFYTNYKSAKAFELKENPHVAMTFLWLPLQRQIRIEGVVSKIDPYLSDEYFSKRPRGSQLGAMASPQSSKISSREELERLFEKVEADNADNENLSRPSHWGGYGVTPNYFEFWQGRDNRMHDRIVYEKTNGEWSLTRLAP